MHEAPLPTGWEGAAALRPLRGQCFADLLADAVQEAGMFDREEGAIVFDEVGKTPASIWMPEFTAAARRHLAPRARKGVVVSRPQVVVNVDSQVYKAVIVGCCGLHGATRHHVGGGRRHRLDGSSHWRLCQCAVEGFDIAQHCVVSVKH